jgi:hypothetical protein
MIEDNTLLIVLIKESIIVRFIEKKLSILGILLESIQKIGYGSKGEYHFRLDRVNHLLEKVVYEKPYLYSE